MKKLIFAALLLSGASSFANAATKLPIDPLHLNAKAATATAAVTAKNVTSIGEAVLNDFLAAQAEAGPPENPADPTGFACYTTVVTNLQGFGQHSPNGVISTGEAIWLLAQTAQKVAGDSNCQSVCGRVQMLAGKVGGLLGSLAVPNVCGTFQSLAE